MPEPPEMKRRRYVAEYALPASRALALTSLPALAKVFDATVQTPVAAELAANWVLGEFSAAANRADMEVEDAPISGAQLGGLLKRVEDGTISGKIAKEVFDAMWAGEAQGPNAADAIIEKRGLRQISDVGAIERIVADVLASSASTVAEYRSGKDKAFNALVGKVMAVTKGKANPAQVNEILKRKLKT